MTKLTTILIYLIALLGLTTQAIEAELVTVAEDGTGDYTTLDAAVDAIPTDITGDPQEPYQIKITGTWNNADTTVVDITGHTTDSTNYIYIYTDSTARHNGKWDETKYRLETTGYANWLDIYDDYVKIDGLQISITPNDFNPYRVVFVRLGNIKTWISNSIIKGIINDYTVSYGFGLEGANSNIVYFWNNIFYDVGGGVQGASANCTFYAYNNTAYNCSSYGFSSQWKAGVGGSIISKNNIAQNCGNGFSGYFHTSSDYNISDIPGDQPASGAHDQTGVTVTFADEANDDFRLSPSDTAAKNQGVNLSTDHNLSFSDDIEGQGRSWGGAGEAWDIGADEQVAISVIIKGDVTIGAY